MRLEKARTEHLIVATPLFQSYMKMVAMRITRRPSIALMVKAHSLYQLNLI